MIATILATALFITTPDTEVSGTAYLESIYSGAVLAGKYDRGDKDWDRKNKEWLDKDDDTPYPDDLDDVDGNGYQDSTDAGEGR